MSFSGVKAVEFALKVYDRYRKIEKTFKRKNPNKNYPAAAIAPELGKEFEEFWGLRKEALEVRVSTIMKVAPFLKKQPWNSYAMNCQVSIKTIQDLLRWAEVQEPDNFLIQNRLMLKKLQTFCSQNQIDLLQPYQPKMGEEHQYQIKILHMKQFLDAEAESKVS